VTTGTEFSPHLFELTKGRLFRAQFTIQGNRRSREHISAKSRFVLGNPFSHANYGRQQAAYATGCFSAVDIHVSTTRHLLLILRIKVASAGKIHQAGAVYGTETKEGFGWLRRPKLLGGARPGRFTRYTYRVSDPPDKSKPLLFKPRFIQPFVFYHAWKAKLSVDTDEFRGATFPLKIIYTPRGAPLAVFLSRWNKLPVSRNAN